MSELVITLPGASLDLLGGRVLRHGKPVMVEPRAWRVLEQLARFRHRVVTKEELLAALRPEGAVSEGALRQAVLAARRAIGDAGPQPIIRSIPRVGYILDVPSAAAAEPATAGVQPDAMPSLIIGPLRNLTGQPGLHWAAHGLVACIAHGLSIDGRIQVQDTQSLEISWAQGHPQMVQMLRAAGARYAVLGSVNLAGCELALDLQIHDHHERTAISIRAASPAALVLPAIEALRHKVLGAAERHTPAGGLRDCSPLSIELFARARHSAAMHRHPAALRALQLLQHLDPGFPRLDLELLRVQAGCGSDDGLVNAARLLEAARRDRDHGLEAQARQCLGTLLHMKGQLREAAQSFEHALVLGRSCMPPHWRGHCLTLLASVECRLGELHSVAARLDEAQTTFTRIGSRWGLLNVLWLRAIMSSLSGHAEQSIRWNRKLVSAARRLNANTALVSVCCNLAGELVYADRLDEARECAEEATATALAIEVDVSLLSTVINIHCLLHRQQGRPDAAAELLSLLPPPETVQDDGYLWQAHGHAAMAAGRVDAAADCFLQAAAACRRHGNRVAEAPLLPWLVEALVLSGRLLLAQAELDRADAHVHLQDESTTANLLYPRALLAQRRQQEPETRALLARLSTAPAALPLFRRLAQKLSGTPGGPPPLPMAPPNGEMRRQYRFAHCLLDVERRELWVEGRRQALAPKPFDVLVHLYRNRHRVVTQDELLDTVWREAAASPEAITQAILKIRQAMRRSKMHTVRVETVHRKGYRLLADAHVAPDDDTAAALLADSHATPERALAIVPLPGGKRGAAGAGAADRDLGYPLEVLGYTLAVHARLKRMSAANVQAGVDAAPVATPEAIAAAIGTRHSGAHVLFARLARRDETLTLEYVLVSPVARIEGSMHDRSPTALGRRLAARLLRLHADTAQAHAATVDAGAWMTQMLDLASRAAEEHRRDEALQILQVILDQDPDHDLAADLKTRIDAWQGTPDGACCTSTCTA